jgi:hypothetical protein
MNSCQCMKQTHVNDSCLMAMDLNWYPYFDRSLSFLMFEYLRPWSYLSLSFFIPFSSLVLFSFFLTPFFSLLFFLNSSMPLHCKGFWWRKILKEK